VNYVSSSYPTGKDIGQDRADESASVELKTGTTSDRPMHSNGELEKRSPLPDDPCRECLFGVDSPDDVSIAVVLMIFSPTSLEGMKLKFHYYASA
jgi:hypothetical protein